MTKKQSNPQPPLNKKPPYFKTKKTTATGLKKMPVFILECPECKEMHFVYEKNGEILPVPTQSQSFNPFKPGRNDCCVRYLLII